MRYNRLGGQFWAGGWWGSSSYVSFFTEVCGLELSDDIKERAKAYQDITESVCWWFPYTNFVMVCGRPSAIRRDEAGQLHSDQKMAIEWPDGWGFHALHGVRFDKDPELWQRIIDQDIELADLGKIQDADKRAVAIQMLRPDRLLKQVNAKLIHTGKKGTQLYEVPNFMDTKITEYCMLMNHPTIENKQYIEWVTHETGERGDADLAQCDAWKNEDGNSIPLENYLLAIEA